MADNNFTNISQEKFRFVQQDEKLHDKALKTKPIGYFKDAWIRFKKNKASVAAAIVLGIILLYAIIVPFVSIYKIGDMNPVYIKCTPELYIGNTTIFDGGKTKPLSDKFLAYYVGIGIAAENPSGYGENTWERGEKSFFNPVISLGEEYVADGETRRTGNVSTYLDKGFRYLTLTRGDLQKLLDWEKESGIQVIYPMVDWSNDYCPDETDANLWYKAKPNYTPVDENGRDMTLDQIKEKGLVDNYLRDYKGDIVYIRSLDKTSLQIRVLYYNYYQYLTGHEPTFLFGSDAGGYDVATRMAYGLRTSLVLSFGVAIVCFIIGAIIGAIEGYYGGWVDLIIERIVDILWRMPLYIIVTLFQMHLVNTGKASVLGGLLLAFCVTGWIGTASLVRTQFYRFKNQEYILAARTLGAKDLRLMFRHIFPNAIGTIITSSVFAIPGVIMNESTFSYLGIVNFNSRTNVSLGTMMADGQSSLQEFPHILLIPAAVIALMMIAFNLFGNGMRDAFNPSLRGADD
ncbi:MAG: ABC transporter permease [Clostridia bacterium]|nr:ABC transporter permease [Clostridia bacterium]